MTVTPPRATAPGNRIRLTSGSDPSSRWWNPGERRGRRFHHRLLTAGGKTHAAFPSQKRWVSGGPAPHPFRSGVYAVLAPRSGNERRSIPPEPRRCAALCVAFRSKYTRASSPGGGSSLTRLVSRAPRRSRRSRGFHHKLLTLHSFRPGFPVSPRLRTIRTMPTIRTTRPT